MQLYAYMKNTSFEKHGKSPENHWTMSQKVSKTNGDFWENHGESMNFLWQFSRANC